MRFALLLLAGSCFAQSTPASWQAAIERPRAASLRGHVSFLASDLLEGRANPSRGLDIAAEYIAAQFRRAGLEPAGEDGYFLTSRWVLAERQGRRARLTAAEPGQENSFPLRNVAGIIRGSDPVLKDTYVLLSAHYDHLGTRPDGDDHIFNGANDDASGVAALLEAAAALSLVTPAPKRTILFVAFFGEEPGLVGSREYARHPAFPLERTIAALHLEQLGRTDADEGPHENRVTLTGFDYSTIGETLAAAGRQLGITVYKHEKNSDAFFNRSDNFSLAEKGIPAHTLATGFLFPDYHQPGDHWDKLDYPHLEKITRLITLGLLNLADAPQPPHWNPDNPRAKRFFDLNPIKPDQ